MHPLFKITSKIVSLISAIERLLGQYDGILRPIPQPLLRRKNRIRTIKDSLMIEGNTFIFDA